MIGAVGERFVQRDVREEANAVGATEEMLLRELRDLSVRCSASRQPSSVEALRHEHAR
jgi:hypothetical protein